MPSAHTPIPGHKPCARCGRPITRSLREGAKRYAARRFCSRDCGNQAQATIPVADKKCLQCGKPIKRNPRDSRWKHAQRRYCTVTCASRGGHEARWAFNTRNRMAPEGYVFNGRFPTPATVKSAWVTVTGPDVSTPAKHACRGLRSPRTLAMLRAALRDHPDLGAALTGHLSDSWAQQDNAG